MHFERGTGRILVSRLVHHVCYCIFYVLIVSLLFCMFAINRYNDALIIYLIIIIIIKCTRRGLQWLKWYMSCVDYSHSIYFPFK